MFLDITVDAPAKSLWLQIKQFNGYLGCSTCKEKGSQLVTGKGKGKKIGEPSGHAAARTRSEMKFTSLGSVCQQRGWKEASEMKSFVFTMLSHSSLASFPSAIWTT